MIMMLILMIMMTWVQNDRQTTDNHFN
jgi:hypothetical protein